MGTLNEEGQPENRPPPFGPDPYIESAENVTIVQIEDRIRTITNGHPSEGSPSVLKVQAQTHNQDGTQIIARFSDSTGRDGVVDMFWVEKLLPGYKNDKSQKEEYVWSVTTPDTHVLDNLAEIGKILDDLEEALANKEAKNGG